MNKKQNINIRMSSYYILMSIFNFQIMWVDISYSGVVQSECPDFTLIIIDLPQRFHSVCLPVQRCGKIDLE